MRDGPSIARVTVFLEGMRPMFSHVAVGTNDLETATRFYDAVLGTLAMAKASLA
jgi:predicted enzyme related to lactoylglutathione lyase